MKKDRIGRQYVIQRLVALAALVLVIKVASLQIVDNTYSKQAEARTLDKKTLYPSRGLVYDREGKLLVFNNPMYDIYATYNSIPDGLDTTALCDLLSIQKSDFDRIMDKPWGSRYSKAVPFLFHKYVSPVEFAVFQEHLYQFGGFSEVLRNVRGYAYPNAGHVLGYISEIDQEAIDQDEDISALGD